MQKPSTHTHTDAHTLNASGMKCTALLKTGHYIYIMYRHYIYIMYTILYAPSPFQCPTVLMLLPCALRPSPFLPAIRFNGASELVAVEERGLRNLICVYVLESSACI